MEEEGGRDGRGTLTTLWGKPSAFATLSVVPGNPWKSVRNAWSQAFPRPAQWEAAVRQAPQVMCMCVTVWEALPYASPGILERMGRRIPASGEPVMLFLPLQTRSLLGFSGWKFRRKTHLREKPLPLPLPSFLFHIRFPKPDSLWPPVRLECVLFCPVAW